MHRLYLHAYSRVMKGAKCLLRSLAVVALFTAPWTSHVPAATQDANTSAPRSLWSMSPKCSVVPDLARLELPLTQVAFRLSGGLPIKVVAIGSSSTAGAGASSPSASYPSRLEGELGRQFPSHAITVANRGVNGDEAIDMVGRFEKAVIAENPHLVLWQLGTNSLLRDRPLNDKSTIIQDGLRRLKGTGADVVFVDPQFAPKVLAKGDAVEAANAYLDSVAKKEKVSLFHRFAIMRHWQQVDRLPFDAFVSPDGLHMNDWSYACLAKWLGFAITEAAVRPAVVVPAR
jgi:acyl-CoA thioesterase-1